MLQDDAEAAVEIGNNGELKPRVKRLQDFWNLRIELPNPGFGEVTVNGLEICVAIQFTHVRRDLIENAIHQFAPPSPVVVFARTVDRWAGRHLFPATPERGIERAGIEAKADALRHECVMMTDTFWQINQSARRIEEDCLDEMVLAFHGGATLL